MAVRNSDQVRRGWPATTGLAVVVAGFVALAAVAAPPRIAGWLEPLAAGRLPPSPPLVAAPQPAADLASLAYDLSAIAEGAAEVPRIIFADLPSALIEIPTVEERKALFVRLTLPILLAANERIAADRAALLGLQRKLRRGVGPSADEARLLARLAVDYGVSDANIEALLRRVDVVPPSLAMAQAAEESGWGTSRFAREGKALFGQWTVSGSGMAPAADETGTVRVRAFASLGDSVRAYMLNLNSHRAYAEFRHRRAELRRAGGLLDGAELAGTLHRYSQRGEDYIGSLRTIMRVNGLAAFDQARLEPPTVRLANAL